MPMLSRCLLLVLALPHLALAVEFNRDVRPILSDACFTCHGPDAKKRKADLRLDTEAGVKQAFAGGVAKSHAWKRISSSDATDRMPPAKATRQLSAREKATLKQWLEQGATWQNHWAFLAPRRASIPDVADRQWAKNPLDAFILARLQLAGLKPSPRADGVTLLRRASLDLTGLPPTPDEVDAFLSDTRPGAYERAVDRLLSSPRFGERMAVRWLDAARYADTSGYQNDGERIMWRWRDWVIEAYNHNLPFDRFTIEQLAGDMLPTPTLDQRIATGFNRNHRGNAEGGIIPEEYAVEYVADRVETTAAVWLGLTLGCARCHDHKYDPLTMKDFYGLYAFFNSIPERGKAVKFGNSPPMLLSPTRWQQERLAEIDAALSKAKAKVEALEPELKEALRKGPWGTRSGPEPSLIDGFAGDFAFVGRVQPGTQFRDGEPAFAPGKIEKATVFDGKRYIEAEESGEFGYLARFSLAAWVYPEQTKRGTIVSRMVDVAEGEGYSVRLNQGRVQVNLVKRWLDDALRVETEEALSAKQWRHVLVVYDGSRVATGVRVYLDGKPVKMRVLLDDLNQTFAVKQPFRVGAGNGPEDRFVGMLNQVVIYDRDLDDNDARVAAVVEDPSRLIRLDPDKRTPGQAEKYRRWFINRNYAPDHIRDAHEHYTRFQRQRRAFIDSLPTTMVMKEMETPRQAHLLLRGEYDKPGEKVSRTVPAVLPTMKGAKPDRLTLAKWLVHEDNPLTARVAVNRVWQTLFGVGLVKTAEDFGVQGEWPSHPELLDWLAVEFRESGWDVKHLLRLIVTSNAYQQSSSVRKEGQERDPENRLIWRGPRLRMPAEMIRDQALSASGLLVERLGGPSVKPYQPAGLWSELADTPYVRDKGADLYRRGLYTYWKRTVPPPGAVTFDAGLRESCNVRETRTNTPLQALNLLNDVTYVEAARVLADRVIQSGKGDEVRLTFLFRVVLSRNPTSTEMKVLQSALSRHRKHYQANPKDAAAVISAGEWKAQRSRDAAEQAAYAAVAAVVLNLDEAVTKE